MTTTPPFAADAIENPSSAGLMAFEALAQQRRTSLRMDVERSVPAELIQRLCELAQWAPNHKRTWPWRFAVLTGQARSRLGEATALFQEEQGAGPEQVAKSRTKYLRSPVVLVVASSSEVDAAAHRQAEDRDAVACAVQTLLLGATAAGLASYWGTGPVTEAPGVKHMCGFARHDTILAAIYLGWPLGRDPSRPERPPADVRWLA